MLFPLGKMKTGGGVCEFSSMESLCDTGARRLPLPYLHMLPRGSVSSSSSAVK